MAPKARTPSGAGATEPAHAATLRMPAHPRNCSSAAAPLGPMPASAGARAPARSRRGNRWAYQGPTHAAPTDRCLQRAGSRRASKGEAVSALIVHVRTFPAPTLVTAAGEIDLLTAPSFASGSSRCPRRSDPRHLPGPVARRRGPARTAGAAGPLHPVRWATGSGRSIRPRPSCAVRDRTREGPACNGLRRGRGRPRRGRRHTSEPMISGCGCGCGCGQNGCLGLSAQDLPGPGGDVEVD